MKDYKVICKKYALWMGSFESTVTDFEKMVSSALAASTDWKPQGGITTASYKGELYLMQAIYREQPK